VRIGVLALQGDFEKHLEMASSLPGVVGVAVKTPSEIDECDGLIIPGGESTTVGKLMDRYGVDRAIKRNAARGMAVFGTCTGMILLAKDIEGSNQHRLSLMDIGVRRNAFGRQIDSFEADLEIEGIDGSPVRAVFIRAPFVTDVRGDAQVLARLDTGEVVMVRQGNLLAAAFHPELTDDSRVHALFADIARRSALWQANEQNA